MSSANWSEPSENEYEIWIWKPPKIGPFAQYEIWPTDDGKYYCLIRVKQPGLAAQIVFFAEFYYPNDAKECCEVHYRQHYLKEGGNQ